MTNVLEYVPGSKSVAARALVLRWLAGVGEDSCGMPDCDDIRILRKGLAAIRRSVSDGMQTVDLGLNGTALRFLAALAASVEGVDVVLTGTQRLCSRPMTPLVDALRKAGADIVCLQNDGFAPLHIRGRLLQGGCLSVRGDISSQFVSALMLVSPLWTNGMVLDITTPLVSAPYVWMTAGIMERFGVSCVFTPERVEVSNGHYTAPYNFEIEPDMSAVSFMCVAGAVLSEGFGRDSLQPDAVFSVLVKEASAKGSVTCDMSSTPDLVPPFVAFLVREGIPFRLSGVAHLAYKESDRLSALKEEMQKTGVLLECSGGELSWSGVRERVEGIPLIDPHGDHRIAMSFASAVAAGSPLCVLEPRVVDKSFPRFWDALRNLGFICEEKDGRMYVSKR